MFFHFANVLVNSDNIVFISTKPWRTELNGKTQVVGDKIIIRFCDGSEKQEDIKGERNLGNRLKKIFLDMESQMKSEDLIKSIS